VVLATAPTLTGPLIESYTVAALPAAVTKKVAVVTDGATAANACTVGGGSTVGLCRYNGAAWAALGDGNTAGTPGFDTITSGSNTTATMTVGTGGTITYSGSGVNNANQYKGNSIVAAGDVNSAVGDGRANYCADAGASDAYACNLSPNPGSYVAGMHHSFKANTANTGAATVNFNSVGVLALKKWSAGAKKDVETGDIGANQIVDIIYDGTDAVVASPLGNENVSTIGIDIDGGGSTITTGNKKYIRVPFACTIVDATLIADQSGSIVIDVWKDTYANYPPTVADTITASAKPTLSAATKSQDTTLTGWTVTVAADDVLGFNVDSATTVQWAQLTLKCKR
jgi:hypothetical protein